MHPSLNWCAIIDHKRINRFRNLYWPIVQIMRINNLHSMPNTLQQEKDDIILSIINTCLKEHEKVCWVSKSEHNN